MKNQTEKPKRGKIGKRAAVLYGVLAIALIGSGLTARYATSLKLNPSASAPSENAAESAPTARFDVSELAQYTVPES